jgi:hypothetical protein
LQVSLYLVESYRVGVDCLKAVSELRLICLGSGSTGAYQLLTQVAVFWIMMGQSLFIRDGQLVPSDISMSQVAVFSGGMVPEECHFLRMKLVMDLY